MEETSAGLVAAIVLAVVTLLIGFSWSGDVVKKDLTKGFTVNGELVSQKKIDQTYVDFSDKTQASKEVAAEQLLDQRLLVQDIHKRGITVPETEVEDALVGIRTYYLRSNISLDDALAQRGITFEEYKQDMEDLLAITKFVNEQLHFDSITVSEEEIDAYIEQNSVGYEEIKNDDAFAASYRNRVRQVILQKKREDLVNQYLEQLRRVAQVEPLVE